ncbi:hypothetical protein DICVIV_05332 [Dictyocaulus viviparus]|uniref:Uncharacterized protein n=1 Tax=Dictyocaulus viviparus TaxID=29172 RepID=A0A0D8Y1R2_DICVI|nr:hypothetical protein DICVIV_05332 [Dictyocaulus viviparus]
MQQRFHECLPNDFSIACSTLVVAVSIEKVIKKGEQALSCAKNSKKRSRGGGDSVISVSRNVSTTKEHDKHNKGTDTQQHITEQKLKSVGIKKDPKELKQAVKRPTEIKSRGKTIVKQCQVEMPEHEKSEKFMKENAPQLPPLNSVEKLVDVSRRKNSIARIDDKGTKILSAEKKPEGKFEDTQETDFKTAEKVKNESTISPKIDSRLMSKLTNVSLMTERVDPRLMSAVSNFGGNSEVVDRRLMSAPIPLDNITNTDVIMKEAKFV